MSPATTRGDVAGRPRCDGREVAHSRPKTSRSTSAASFTSPWRASIMPTSRRAEQVTLLKGAGMGVHRRPEIAGFMAKAYETLQSKAGRTEASPQKINAVEVVHSRLLMRRRVALMHMTSYRYQRLLLYPAGGIGVLTASGVPHVAPPNPCFETHRQRVSAALLAGEAHIL